MSSKVFIEANDHTTTVIEHYLVKDKYFGGGGGLENGQNKLKYGKKRVFLPLRDSIVRICVLKEQTLYKSRCMVNSFKKNHI